MIGVSSSMVGSSSSISEPTTPPEGTPPSWRRGIGDGSSSMIGSSMIGASSSMIGSSSVIGVSSSRIGSSSKNTPSFSTTLSKWAKGLFTTSLRVASGVKVILLWPWISKRSPVFTLMLSRLSTSMSLNVPNPLILTYRSVCKASSISLKNSLAKASISFFEVDWLPEMNSTSSCMVILSFIAH